MAVLEQAFRGLLDVARRFLQKKATVSELRAAVREAEKTLEKSAPTSTRDGGHRKH